MLPNARLLARAFHRIPATNGVRCLSNTAPLKKWEGRKADQHTTREGDHHNIQQDESRTAKHMKEGGNESSGAISEKDSKDDGKKAKEAAPKQPGPIIGMNDERGGVSLTQQIVKHNTDITTERCILKRDLAWNSMYGKSIPIQLLYISC